MRRFAPLLALVAGALLFALSYAPIDPHAGTHTAHAQRVPPAETEPTATPRTRATATATPAPADPTATPLPDVPPTPAPPTATATPGASGPVPACAGHDDRAWHGLVERDSSGQILCTYGHEHGDDPHALDGVLGPLPAYLGGSISYPFETANENHHKHATYKWYTYSGACNSGNDPYGFRHLRVQMHDNSLGWMTRFHSGWVQAEACSASDPSYSGIFELGGHFDWGALFVDGVHVPLPGDPITLDTGRKRSHDGPGSKPGNSVWYGYNDNIDRKFPTPSGGTFLTTAFSVLVSDPWGPVDPNNPAADLRYGGSWNASNRVLHRVRFAPVKWMDQKDGTQDGVANLSGYLDRDGYFVDGCTVVSPDCIPYRLGGLRLGAHEFLHNDQGGGFSEYDVLVNGQSLSSHPN
jgi:hypothetical protein